MDCSRRKRIVLCGVSCLMTCGAMFTGTALALQPGCSQSGSTVTCTYTAGENSFTVPAGVSSLDVVAVGGTGSNPFPGYAQGGGAGARVSGQLAVIPGSTLFAVVAGNADGRTPGANGGGSGAVCNGYFNVYSGAGGGASDVRTNATDLESRVLVAGGGGGDGCGNEDTGNCVSSTCTPSTSGDAGFPGFPASPETDGATGGGGGSPGTASAGGSGGSGGSPANGGGSPGSPGSAGTLGTGGSGGEGGGGPCPGWPTPEGCSSTEGGGGGGGGGGLFGGGGGGGGAGGAVTSPQNPVSGSGGGGGGGGSSLAPSGALVSIDTTGQPEVVISYAVPTAGGGGGGGPSNVCNAAGAPSTTQTVGVKGVLHVTVFTCGDATANGFQQCPQQTFAVPNVTHTTLYYCLPPGFTFGGNGLNQTVSVGGVGGVSAGTG